MQVLELVSTTPWATDEEATLGKALTEAPPLPQTQRSSLPKHLLRLISAKTQEQRLITVFSLSNAVGVCEAACGASDQRAVNPGVSAPTFGDPCNLLLLRYPPIYGDFCQ